MATCLRGATNHSWLRRSAVWGPKEIMHAMDKEAMASSRKMDLATRVATMDVSPGSALIEEAFLLKMAVQIKSMATPGRVGGIGWASDEQSANRRSVGCPAVQRVWDQPTACLIGIAPIFC